MWIFSTKGFISVVKHRNKADTFLVRGRNEAHIREVCDRADVTFTAKADYPYRIEVSKVELARILFRLADKLNYTNFKSAVKEEVYYWFLNHIWSIMIDYEERITGRSWITKMYEPKNKSNRKWNNAEEIWGVDTSGNVYCEQQETPWPDFEVPTTDLRIGKDR